MRVESEDCAERDAPLDNVLERHDVPMTSNKAVNADILQPDERLLD